MSEVEKLRQSIILANRLKEIGVEQKRDINATQKSEASIKKMRVNAAARGGASCVITNADGEIVMRSVYHNELEKKRYMLLVEQNPTYTLHTDDPNDDYPSFEEGVKNHHQVERKKLPAYKINDPAAAESTE